ncbi:hypothetical protein MCOR25_002668 [Pyricularia grisea]|uniref:Cystinosin n=1 Tax=Pyricularia grisea TaxID=148305 RepID=A0A6P8B9Q0_PYRGI|nr:uncharacterized protein PgNI_03291 [Pyricularia grisea]KAI6376703.1 hypothetical protein MCOR25_002668 [Pyricularia grisea]TLD12392.1 hypothetical protein PgNI_03291 [Pyricularia grisea]
MDMLPWISWLFGWIYFTCWSLSFYPQAILNNQRKSTTGTTIDFPLSNCLGFFSYFIYNLAFCYSPIIRSQYAARNHGLEPTTRLNDVVFALHGFILSCVTTSQYIPGLWGGFERAPVSQRPSRWMLGIITGCIIGVACVFLFVAGREGPGTDPARDWCWLDVMYAVSYVKLIVTLVKYTPQVIVNHRNRSTKGWSISQIALDFSGGLLSIAQQSIDSYLQHDWSGFTGNPVKLGLANVSMIYDSIFFAQHYVLYPSSALAKGPEAEGLLGRDEEERRLD